MVSHLLPVLASVLLQEHNWQCRLASGVEDSLIFVVTLHIYIAYTIVCHKQVTILALVAIANPSVTTV